jgi:hypothetical protein
MKVKRLLAATAIALAMITSANAGCTGGPYREEIENACNHGWVTAAFEKVCPGMTVGDPALRAKLDKKYRTNPKMKKYFNEYYDMVAKQDTTKLTGVMSMCFTAAGFGNWIKWDETVTKQGGTQYRFIVFDNATGEITKLERHVGNGEWELIDEEPPFSLQVLVRHRLKGFA